jgi:hypothetical protein
MGILTAVLWLDTPVTRHALLQSATRWLPLNQLQPSFISGAGYTCTCPRVYIAGSGMAKYRLLTSLRRGKPEHEESTTTMHASSATCSRLGPHSSAAAAPKMAGHTAAAVHHPASEPQR